MATAAPPSSTCSGVRACSEGRASLAGILIARLACVQRAFAHVLKGGGEEGGE